MTDNSSQYCQGPADLTEHIQRSCPPHLSVVSNEGLRRLVDVTYRVSLMKEEGRYPCFQIIVPQSTEQVSHLPVRFEIPLLLDTETLHRLIPGAPQRPFALFVNEEADGTLRARGVGRAESSVLALDETGEASWGQ